jgi:predicted lysophospholipase L1 biosynthesis ABC-type transport system permease subunit
MRFCNERTTVLIKKRRGRESTMRIKEIHMKIIAIGLLPVFLILAFTLPNTATTSILLGGIIITVLVVILIGKSMQKKEENEDDDLLAIPPKKS